MNAARAIEPPLADAQPVGTASPVSEAVLATGSEVRPIIEGRERRMTSERRMLNERRDPTPLAAVLLVAYVVQAAVRLEWPWLVALQAQDAFKVATGCLLVIYLWLQWSIAAHRRHLHSWLGAFAPVVLYLHATHFAFGYLVWLAAVYLGIGAIGLLHRPIVARRARALFTWWFVIHLALSALLIVLAVYHVVIAVAYE